MILQRFVWIILFVLSFTGLPAYAGTPDIVKVGGYAFPPFVTEADQDTSGMTLDLIKALNAYQEKYRFEFFLTSPRRRYHAFEKGYYDMIFFENIRWGWEGKPVEASKVFLKGGEVYITKAVPGRDQRYFDSLKGKTLAGILGYHYQFAGFIADPAYLRERHGMKLYTRHDAIFKPVLTGQVDVAVVTASFLKHFLKKNPQKAPELLVSEKFDQIYNHTIIIRKHTHPGVDEINRLLTDMEQKGILNKLWKRYGIQ
jgi:ABC-type amino acid transport substrate-binding protein